MNSNFPGVPQLIALPGIAGYIWLLFLLTAALLTFLATRMVKSADVLIFKTKFGGAFVGSVVISIINASPELIAAVTQSAFGTPAVGLADDIGANAIAGVLILLSAIFLYKDLFLTRVRGLTRTIIIISIFGNLAYAIVLLVGVDVPLGSIGLIPLFFFAMYLVAIFLQYKFGGKVEHSVGGLSPKLQEVSVKKAMILFTVYSVLLFATAFMLNYLIQGFQIAYGIGAESAGGIFLAISTSLPEIVSFLYFVRRKKPLLGLGTLVWASIFNTSLLFWADVAYTPGPVISAAHTSIFEGKVWAIGFMVVVLITFYIIPSFFTKFMEKYKVAYFATVSVGALMFVVGWALILSIPIHSEAAVKAEQVIRIQAMQLGNFDSLRPVFQLKV